MVLGLYSRVLWVSGFRLLDLCGSGVFQLSDSGFLILGCLGYYGF